jgi:hypothetical protein
VELVLSNRLNKTIRFTKKNTVNHGDFDMGYTEEMKIIVQKLYDKNFNLLGYER